MSASKLDIKNHHTIPVVVEAVKVTEDNTVCVEGVSVGIKHECDLLADTDEVYETLTIEATINQEDMSVGVIWKNDFNEPYYHITPAEALRMIKRHAYGRALFPRAVFPNREEALRRIAIIDNHIDEVSRIWGEEKIKEYHHIMDECKENIAKLREYLDDLKDGTS